jgi:hypothetical protein
MAEKAGNTVKNRQLLIKNKLYAGQGSQNLSYIKVYSQWGEKKGDLEKILKRKKHGTEQ